MSMNFNINSEKTRFIFKPNLIDPKTFDIFENRRGYDDYVPAGSYVVLDANEDKGLTEKKLVNLIGLMNGKGNTVNLYGENVVETFFQVIPKKVDSDPSKVIYRTRTDGITKENALLTVRRGVFDE